MAQKFSKPFYNSKEWQSIREYILMRDKYLCKCGKPAEEVHHIIWLNSININDKAISCGENNLISVCKDCHFKIHSRKKHDVNEGYEFDANGYVIQTVDTPLSK